MAKHDPRRLPSPAKKDLDSGRHDYVTIMAPVWKLTEALVRRVPPRNSEVFLPSAILRAMGDTHESMRAILRASEEHAKQTGTDSGRSYDVLYLARPQVESVFVGLLLLHDWNKYGPLYRKAAWAKSVHICHYHYLRVRNTASGQAWWNEQVGYWRAMAAELGITEAEAKAAIADLTGESLSPREKQAAIAFFPTPGQVTRDDLRLLRGSPCEKLGDMLFYQWSHLCDPVHVGLESIMTKAHLRGDPVDKVDFMTQEDLDQGIIHRSVGTSMVCITSLATAITVSLFRGELPLIKLCAEAWDSHRTGLALSSLIWDDWARQALGILESA
jgi:hypothetical protein